MMKRILLFLIIGVMIYSCTPSRPHELMGSQPRRPYYPELPVGMVYIPAGGFTLGLQDQDIFMTQDAKHKVVSIASFYMDQTEITNNEYRQFVDWVRDSIALEKLVDRALAEDVEDYINFEQDVLFADNSEEDEDNPFVDFYSNNENADYSDPEEESKFYGGGEKFETDAGALIDLIMVDDVITKDKRKKLDKYIKENSIWAIGQASTKEIEKMIHEGELKDLIADGREVTSIIPDIESVNYGRGVGYEVIEHIPPKEIGEISATSIREQMRKDGKL